MKKLLLFFALTTFTTTVFAQFAIGPRAGLHFSSVAVDPDEDTEGTLGLMFGAVAELGLSDNFAIQPEASYVKRGFDREFDDDGDLFSSDLRINYLDFGALAKLKTSSEGFYGYLGAGPYYSYALSGELETEFLGINNTAEVDFDDDESFERGDWSVAFAAGIGVPLGESHFFLDARYLLGLVDIEKGEDTDVRNRGVSVSAGFLFGF